MELLPWSPTRDLEELREQVERVTMPAPGWAPAADWFASDDELVLILDVPGVNVEELEVGREVDAVIVAGQRSDDLNGMRLYGDRPLGAFRRVLSFPEPVEDGVGQATLAGGVLTLRFRKRNVTIDVGLDAG